MGFKLVDYEKLALNIKQSIDTEVRRHNIDSPTLKDALKELRVKQPDRALQCRYLLTVLKCLDASSRKTADKTCVLNAAVLYVRNQILESYEGSYAGFLISPVNSTLFNSLSISLDLNNDNLPDSNDLLELYAALGHFMMSHVYKDSNPKKGYLEASQQPFKKISGFEVETMLSDLIPKVADLKLQLIDLTKKEQLGKKISVGKNSGVEFFGLFGGKNGARCSSDAAECDNENELLISVH